MGHTGIFATSDEILTKAGADYSTGVTEAKINALCLQAESIINVGCMVNFSDLYATLNADVKGILAALESDLVAIYIINYQMSGYTSRATAQTMLDVLRDRTMRYFEILNNPSVKKWIVNPV